MSKDREHIVGNQSPKAKIYFVDKDWELRNTDFIGPKVLTPDIDDILELQTTRGTTGHGGHFKLVLSNKDNKYFTVDDIEDEIQQLNSLDNRTPAKEKDELYGKDPYPYIDGRDFLNALQMTLRHDVEDNKYGEHKPGVDTSFILQQNEDDEWGYFNIPAKEMVDNELSPSNAANYWVPLSSGSVAEKEQNAARNSDFFVKHGGDLNQGRCMFEPMQRIIILLSRRFSNNQDELRTVFTGLVSSVSDSYQENLYTITIQGEDLTKWMRVTQINMNPSFVRVSDLPGSEDFLITQHKFADMEGWQIIQTLILGGETQTQKEFGGLGHWAVVKEHRLGPDQEPMRDSPSAEDIQEITPVGLPGEWIGSGKSDNDQILKKDKLHLQVFHGVTAKKDKGTHIITPYKLFFKRSANAFDNEYSTVWDVATDVAKLTNFEFYADAYGDLWYHQPRFNNYHILNAINSDVYVIRDEDIISHDFTEADENIITSLFVTGMQDLIEDFPIPLGLANFYEDYSFVRKYGRRFLFTHHPYVRTKQDCWYFAKSLMQRINAERFTGQITILGRPEIDLAMPVYIAYKNTIYYIKEVSHNFKFGGQYTTTLQLVYGRKPWEILPEILDYKTIPPQLASKEFREKYGLIKEFPLSVEFFGVEKNMFGGDQVSSTPAGYVVNRDSKLFIPSSATALQMSTIAGGIGYLLSTTFGWGHQGRSTEQLQSDLAAGKVHTTVKVKATIDGYIDVNEVMSDKSGFVRIHGTGDDVLFTVTYVGLGGDDYRQLVRNVEEKRKNEETYYVKAGETILGELTHTVLQGQYALQPQLYYAVQHGGKPVWPNEVHTTKFVDKQGDIWVDSKGTATK